MILPDSTNHDPAADLEVRWQIVFAVAPIAGFLIGAFVL